MGAAAVFLVGFMGSGKTSVGRELARRLRWDFIDLDARIETREQGSIPEIFRATGEPGFRRAETAALRELTEALGRDSVVALGGGAFAQQNNRNLLRKWPSVFLEAPVDELWQRCCEDGTERPLRTDREQFAQLYAERLPFYREATLVVNTSAKDLAAICTEIESGLRLGNTRDGVSSQPQPAGSETGGLQ